MNFATKQMSRVLPALVWGATALTLEPPAARADALTWYAVDKHSPRWTKGDDTCDRDSVDCNPCVADVEAQFRESWNYVWDEQAYYLCVLGQSPYGPRDCDYYTSRTSWGDNYWTMNDGSRYAPSNLKPNDVYEDGYGSVTGTIEDGIDFLLPGDQAGIEFSTTHVQGFIKGNQPFMAITHSDDDYGSFSFIEETGYTRPRLEAIHRTDSKHPSAPFLLGQYVGFADGSNFLHLLDYERRNQSHSLGYGIPGSQPLTKADGGLAMVKLRDGGYLVVVSEGSNKGGNYLFHVGGDIESPGVRRFLRKVEYDFGSSAPLGIGSEQVSIVTECDTGNIYTIHASGEDFGKDLSDARRGDFDGTGHWRLSKVEISSSGVTTRVVQVQEQNQNMGKCWLRGGASAFAGSDGVMDYYCHGRGQYDDDRFYYRKGRGYGNIEWGGITCPPQGCG